jgi:hypothetical protein
MSFEEDLDQESKAKIFSEDTISEDRAAPSNSLNSGTETHQPESLSIDSASRFLRLMAGG